MGEHKVVVALLSYQFAKIGYTPEQIIPDNFHNIAVRRPIGIELCRLLGEAFHPIIAISSYSHVNMSYHQRTSNLSMAN